jgi:hypothetical protein
VSHLSRPAMRFAVRLRSVGRARAKKRRLIGGRIDHRPTDVLGLEERPGVGGFDIGVDCLGLCAFTERLRERQEQRQHRDHQRDPLVEAFGERALL